MATLLEILGQLSPEQMREGESITVVDGRGRETVVTFGPKIDNEPSAPLFVI